MNRLSPIPVIINQENRPRWIGFRYPMEKTSHGFLTKVTDIDVIKSDIIQLILTEPGERVMMPEYGCGLRDLTFEPNVLNNTLAPVTVAPNLFNRGGAPSELMPQSTTPSRIGSGDVATEARNRIIRVINTWEPRIILRDVSVNPPTVDGNIDEHALKIYITFSPKEDLNTEETIQINIAI